MPVERELWRIRLSNVSPAASAAHVTLPRYPVVAKDTGNVLVRRPASYMLGSCPTLDEDARLHVQHPTTPSALLRKVISKSGTGHLDKC